MPVGRKQGQNAGPQLTIPVGAFADASNPLESEVTAYFGTLSPSQASGQLASYTDGDVDYAWEWDGVNAHLINQTVEAFGTSQPTTVDYKSASGDGLFTNGTGLLGNNYNLPEFIYDRAIVNGTVGSFRHDGDYVQKGSVERISLNLSLAHVVSAQILVSTNNTKRQWIGLNFLDADDNSIIARNHMFANGSLSTLTRDFTPGDAFLYVDNVDGWDFNQANQYRRGITLWDYVNGAGFAFPPQTYSRRLISSLWNNGDAPTDIGGGEWEVPTKTTGYVRSNVGTTELIPTGTMVSNTENGDSFKYVVVRSEIVPTDGEWHTYGGHIGGIDSTGTNRLNAFPPGATAAEVKILPNFSGTSANDVQVWFNAIDMRVDTSVSFAEDGVYTPPAGSATAVQRPPIPFTRGHRPVAAASGATTDLVIP